MKVIKPNLPSLSWGVYSLCGLICAFFISWLLLAKVDFAYGYLHDAMNIQQHSRQYGPQNRHRHGFQYTTKAEHIRLFSAINDSIHNHGNGLEKITYHHKDGKIIDKLLHKAEVIHLKDVSNLLDVLKYLGLVASLIWLTLFGVFHYGLLPSPNIKQQSKSIITLVGLSALITLLIGPTKVFYHFHEWIFPQNHQWFFYYQESLMTILMKAPDLFGAIAILLTLLALVIFIIMNLAQYSLNKHFPYKH